MTGIPSTDADPTQLDFDPFLMGSHVSGPGEGRCVHEMTKMSIWPLVKQNQTPKKLGGNPRCQKIKVGNSSPC